MKEKFLLNSTLESSRRLILNSLPSIFNCLWIIKTIENLKCHNAFCSVLDAGPRPHHLLNISDLSFLLEQNQCSLFKFKYSAIVKYSYLLASLDCHFLGSKVENLIWTNNSNSTTEISTFQCTNGRTESRPVTSTLSSVWPLSASECFSSSELRIRLVLLLSVVEECSRIIRMSETQVTVNNTLSLNRTIFNYINSH